MFWLVFSLNNLYCMHCIYNVVVVVVVENKFQFNSIQYRYKLQRVASHFGVAGHYYMYNILYKYLYIYIV